MRARPITPQAVVEQVSRGASIREVARMYDIAIGTVYHHLRREAYRLPAQRAEIRRWAHQAARRYMAGETIAQIAAEAGIRPMTAYHRLWNAGYRDFRFCREAWLAHQAWAHHQKPNPLGRTARHFHTTPKRLRASFSYFGYRPRGRRITAAKIEAVTRDAHYIGCRRACNKHFCSVADFAWTARHTPRYTAARAALWRAFATHDRDLQPATSVSYTKKRKTAPQPA